MIRRPVLVCLALLAGCAPQRQAAPAPAPPPAADAHLPPYARLGFEAFSRMTVVAIAEREWRAFGSVVDDDPPTAAPRGPRPDQQPGLWQRVADYWWSSQDFGAPAGAWSSRYDEAGSPYQTQAPAWSAAFVSYVMRAAGAGQGFPYSPLHADYINAAARNEGFLHAERVDLYAPQPGDLVCAGRGEARGMRFEDLPATRFFGHCDIVVKAEAGVLEVIGGNVFGGVTKKHVPTTDQGRLATETGRVMDPRFPWFVVLRAG